MGSSDGKTQSKDKLCWTCETKVQAIRIHKPWGAGDLLVVAVTFGLWFPIRLMYDAVARPWLCARCENRIDPWYKALGRAAGYGFGCLVAAWIALPGLIAVFSESPTRRNDTATAGRSAQAIERERARRDETQSEFAANRTQIIADIKSDMSQLRFSEAAKRAKPYLFIADAELAGLHSLARKKAEEFRLLRAARDAPASDLARNVELYAKLEKADPSNSTYQQKHSYYAAKLNAKKQQEAAKAATARRKAAAEKAKQDAVVAKFGPAPVQSVWDGSYGPVESYLKRVANDPDSIDIDACTEVYRANDGWLVGCDYRGRNGFGGMIRKSNWFTIRHLKVVAIHESSAYKQ